MKLLIIGHARHGKDTVAQIICNLTGWTFISSSRRCAEDVVRPYLQAKGVSYPSDEDCYNDRANHRAAWHDAITAYNTPDKTRLAQLIYNYNQIYVGLRHDEEWYAIKAAAIYDYSIWVDRSLNRELEPRDSMKLGPWAADFVVDNNRDLLYTATQCKRIVEWMK